MTRYCVHCGAEYILTPTKPGKINECFECAEDVPRLQAAQCMDDTGCVDGFLRGPYPNGLAAMANGSALGSGHVGH